MEMIFGLHDQRLWEKEKSTYLSTTNPLYLCQNKDIPEDTKDICYIYITPYFYHFLNVPMSEASDEIHEKALSFCNEIPITDKKNRDNCFGGFGKEFIPLAKDKDLRNLDKLTDAQFRKVYHWCTLARDSNGITSCIKQAANASYWGGKFPENPTKFCQIIENPAYKRDCLDYNLIERKINGVPEKID